MFVNDGYHPEEQNGQDFVEWIHAASLQPFGYGRAGVTKSQFLKNVIDPVRF